MNRLLALATVACALLVGVAPAQPAAGPCSTGTTASTASYRLSLELSPQEEMYMASEVKARGITKGEIMLGGEMAMVASAARVSRISPTVAPAGLS